MSLPLFPKCLPKMTDRAWFDVDHPCDHEDEVSQLEKEHQEWVNNSELYYLRVLLKHVRGATSFRNLREMPDGTVCDTYREVCARLHLFDDADLYKEALSEASLKDQPGRLRRLYARIILVTLDVVDAITRTNSDLTPIGKTSSEIVGDDDEEEEDDNDDDDDDESESHEDEEEDEIEMEAAN